jgi:DNA polymerase IV
MNKRIAPFRKILHLDLDAFFCAVEENLNPELKGKAFAVGGTPEGRGVVTSCSYAARKFGIKSAMPMIQVIRIYPELLVVPSHFEEYSKASRQVMEILRNITPLFEQVSIDEAFLDVTDLPDPSRQIAEEIQKKILTQLALPCSIGIATNKLIAKIATNIGKTRNRGMTAPMSILEVPPGEEEKFLAPLPIDEMWGIGPKTAGQIKKLGIYTIGDVAKFPEESLVKNLGKYGVVLLQHARGMDDRLVAEGGEIKSVSSETTFFKDVANEDELINTLINLSTKIGYRLRKKSMGGYTIKLKIRWPDFQTQSRQMTLLQPTNQDSVIISSVKTLFYQIWKKGMQVRLIGVGVCQLTDQFQQLALFDHKNEKERRLLQAVDELNLKFGKKTVHRGSISENPHQWKE